MSGCHSFCERLNFNFISALLRLLRIVASLIMTEGYFSSLLYKQADKSWSTLIVDLEFMNSHKIQFLRHQVSFFV